MADFCKQCSLDIFKEDFKELAGITKPEEQVAGQYAVVICEGCGPTLVDVDGACVSAGCMKKHGRPKEPDVTITGVAVRNDPSVPGGVRLGAVMGEVSGLRSITHSQPENTSYEEIHRPFRVPNRIEVDEGGTDVVNDDDHGRTVFAERAPPNVRLTTWSKAEKAEANRRYGPTVSAGPSWVKEELARHRRPFPLTPILRQAGYVVPRSILLREGYATDD